MALDKDRLGLALKNAVEGITTDPESAGFALQYWTAVADKIIDEITTNAEVISNGQTGPTVPATPATITNLEGVIT
jgi:hypothetical protein